MAALASEDYDVVVAKNGREAIEHFREGHFDIALLDLNMPVKGGWEAFERLTTIHPRLQVIVITAGRINTRWQLPLESPH